MGTKYRGTQSEVEALDAYIKLMRASESVAARVMKAYSLGSTTASQFAVLEALYFGGPMCASALAYKQLKSRGNLTLVIDNLEKRGLVERVRSQDDRRMVQIHLTVAGEDVIKSLMPGHVAAIEAEMRRLTSEELAALGCLCKRLGKGDTEPSRH